MNPAVCLHSKIGPTVISFYYEMTNMLHILAEISLVDGTKSWVGRIEGLKVVVTGPYLDC